MIDIKILICLFRYDHRIFESNVFSAIKYLVSISGHALYGRLTFCLVVLCLQVWSLKVEQEVEKNKALTEALQTLATENHELKQSLSKRRKSSNLSTLNEDDFYDAVSGQQPLGRSNQ